MEATMKFVEANEKVDLTSWGITDMIGAAFWRQVSETIQQQLIDTPPRLDLPFYWRENDGRKGPCPADPLTLYLTLPLGIDEDAEVNFQVSFEAVIDDTIDSLTNLEGKSDKDGTAHLQQLARRLREMADKLDSVPTM